MFGPVPILTTAAGKPAAIFFEKKGLKLWLNLLEYLYSR